MLLLPPDTPPSPGSPSVGADQRRPQPFWDAILAQSPELMILMGDNVYGDVTRPR